MSFIFPPKGWALCNGQLLPINQNQGLFSLLGTNYGGDGRVNFALPDLRGRAILSDLANLGVKAGAETATVTGNQVPQHTHTVAATSTVGDVIPPTGAYLAGAKAGGNQAPLKTYAQPGALVELAADTLSVSPGGTDVHENMQPSLVLSYCIALQGIFPSPN